MWIVYTLLILGAPDLLAEKALPEEISETLVSGGQYEIEWFSIDAGSGRAVGGSFELNGLFSGPAGSAAAGSFEMTSGFLANPVQASGALIFIDGFESGGLSRWSDAAGVSSFATPFVSSEIDE